MFAIGFVRWWRLEFVRIRIGGRCLLESNKEVIYIWRRMRTRILDSGILLVRGSGMTNPSNGVE